MSFNRIIILTPNDQTGTVFSKFQTGVNLEKKIVKDSQGGLGDIFELFIEHSCSIKWRTNIFISFHIKKKKKVFLFKNA